MMTADPSPEDVALFEELEAAFNTAMVSNDVERIAGCIADDWCLVTPEKGPVEGVHVLAAIRDGILSHDSMSKRLDRVKVYGDMAVVIGRGRNTGTFRGAPIRADEWVTDIYRRTGGQWRCVLTHLTPALEGEGNRGDG